MPETSTAPKPERVDVDKQRQAEAPENSNRSIGGRVKNVLNRVREKVSPKYAEQVRTQARADAQNLSDVRAMIAAGGDMDKQAALVKGFQERDTKPPKPSKELNKAVSSETATRMKFLQDLEDAGDDREKLREIYRREHLRQQGLLPMSENKTETPDSPTDATDQYNTTRAAKIAESVYRITAKSLGAATALIPLTMGIAAAIQNQSDVAIGGYAAGAAALAGIGEYIRYEYREKVIEHKRNLITNKHQLTQKHPKKFY